MQCERQVDEVEEKNDPTLSERRPRAPLPRVPACGVGERAWPFIGDVDTLPGRRGMIHGMLAPWMVTLDW